VFRVSHVMRRHEASNLKADLQVWKKSYKYENRPSYMTRHLRISKETCKYGQRLTYIKRDAADDDVSTRRASCLASVWLPSHTIASGLLMNEACLAYEWVRVMNEACMNESCRMSRWVMSRIRMCLVFSWMRYVSRMSKSWMRHVSRMNESESWMRPVSRMNESRRMSRRVMSRIRMRLVS